MQKKIAMIMDNIKHIKSYKDSSFAMLLEANRRNYELWVFDVCDIFANKDNIFASTYLIEVFDNNDKWFEIKEHKVINLLEFNIIFMRKDPPFNMEYIYATYLLELLQKKGVLIINRPSSLRDCNEKLFILNFPDLITDTIVSSDYQIIKNFADKHKTIILKPLDGMGGRDIFKVDANEDIAKVVKYLTKEGKCKTMAQRFIPEIYNGDKRILLINGIAIDYALARIPAAGSFKGNLAAQATGVGQKLTKNDKLLCERLKPVLQKKGLIFVGIDVIGDYLTEINVTSPTCIRELDSQFELNIAGTLFDSIERIIN